MIELSKHIEVLLLDNDCVIVPGLGGFITHHQPAQYEEDEGLFLPPVRMVAFNPQLTMNDGLLVQSYMQSYHTDYSDAFQKINGKVELMKETLHKEGVVEMPGIGELHFTMNETYEFHPNTNGVLAPALYALDAFRIMPLATIAEVSSEQIQQSEQPSQKIVKKKETIRMNPNWWSNAVAVAVAAVLFFVLSVPVENTYIEKGNYASLGTDCLFDAIRSQSVATVLTTPEAEQVRVQTNVTPVAVKVEKVASAPETVAAKAESKKESAVADKKKPLVDESPKAAVKEVPKAKAPQAKAKAKKKYHLIVASLTTDKDAQRVLQTYKQQGHHHVQVLGNNGRFRISLCNYTDQTAAYRKLNELKQDEAFKNAWMLTSK